MKLNQWTLGLAALGVISAASVATADEAKSSIATALSSTTLSGYVDTSAQWNLGKGNAGAPAYSFGGAAKADGFNLNAVKLTLAKDADAAETWGAGYKVDVLFGPDANTFGTAALGGGAGTSDFAIKQAYVDLKAPVGTGLDIKMGVFDTIIGYEVFESINNPNFTRSWAYTIEPTTHTGVLLGYNITEAITVQAGIANTFGATINQRANAITTTSSTLPGFNVTPSETDKTYLASIAYTAPTNMGWFSGSTIYGCVINGFNNASSSFGGRAGETSWYVGSTINTPLQKLKLGASYDYASNNKHNTGIKGYAWAVDLYALYQLTEKLTLNGRAEYAVLNPNGATGLASLGTPTKVFALTATMQYDLWKNVVSRLEARWDHAADGSRAFGAATAGANPKILGSRANSYELIANIAYKF